MPRLGTGKTKVYIKFDSLPSAQKGHQNLHGRSFEARCESFPLGIFQQISVPDNLLLRIWQACGGELLPRGEIRSGGVRVRRQCFRAQTQLARMRMFLSRPMPSFYLAGLLRTVLAPWAPS